MRARIRHSLLPAFETAYVEGCPVDDDGLFQTNLDLSREGRSSTLGLPPSSGQMSYAAARTDALCNSNSIGER